MNNERPQWHLDVETAQRECRVCFDKWQTLTSRIRKLVEEHEEYAPDAFKTSILELMPEFVRAANAAVARLQIMIQIKCGEMRFNEDKPEESGDSSKSK
jgi:transposase